jgi:DNA polymerase III delta prime subunit
MDISIIKDEPNLEDLDLVNKKLIYFKSLNINNLPNLLFKGVSGSGKTTQINALLCTLLDKRIYQLTNRKVEIDKKEFKFLSSIFHLEIDICDFIGNERIFFNHYLKDYISSMNIGFGIPKIIYIKNIDKLSNQVLLYFRKFIENYSKTAKFIFEVKNINILPEPLISRFLIFFIKSPTRDEILICINNQLKKNKIKISKSIVLKILDTEIKYNIYYNLKNIFIQINYYLLTNEILNNNFYHLIDQIIKIVNNKNINFKSLFLLKSYLEKIFINCYDCNELIYSVNYILSKKNKDNENYIITLNSLTIQCENDLSKSTGKYFIHLEKYFLKIINLTKSLNLKNNS